MRQDGAVEQPGVGRLHRRAALVVASLLLMAGAASVPFDRVMLPQAPWFMPTFGALIILTDGLTACLLIVQSGLPGMGRSRLLGIAYLFSALIALPHLLSFPGVFGPGALFGAADTPVYLWCFWHGGFAVTVLAFLAGPVRRPAARMSLGTILITGAVVGALTVAATAGLPWLPALLQNGSYQHLINSGIGPSLVMLCLVSTIVAVLRTRCQTPLSAWLMAGMIAATLDVLLTVYGAGRFTLGWYGARVLSLLTGVTVLFALLAELMREASRVAEVNARLENLLRTDVLTGVANRRAFSIALESEWKRCERAGNPVSLLMIDVDHFKKFNDRYGHLAGDECLRQVAGALAAEAKRPADLAARIGGEEFAVLLPMSDEAGAFYVAKRIHDRLGAMAIPHKGSALGRVGISTGVATIRPRDLTAKPATLVDRADQALYAGKEGGRNRVKVFTKTREPSSPRAEENVGRPPPTQSAPCGPLAP